MNLLFIETRIRELAKQKGVSIAKLSKNIGMSRNGFDTTFQNESLKIGTLIKISEVLEVPMSYFISEVEYFPPTTTIAGGKENTTNPDAEKVRLKKILAKERKKRNMLEEQNHKLVDMLSKHSGS